jgi:hypothetical protein
MRVFGYQESTQFEFGVTAGISGSFLIFSVSAQLRWNKILKKTVTKTVTDTSMSVYQYYATISAGNGAHRFV